jgi:excisionase family DNA binding protein
MKRRVEKHLFLTVADVATALGMSPDTIHRWCREGRIRTRRFGRCVRIRHSDFLALIGEQPTDESRRS